jgi:hypothetical protein
MVPLLTSCFLGRSQVGPGQVIDHPDLSRVRTPASTSSRACPFSRSASTAVTHVICHCVTAGPYYPQDLDRHPIFQAGHAGSNPSLTAEVPRVSVWVLRIDTGQVSSRRKTGWSSKWLVNAGQCSGSDVQTAPSQLG